MNITFDSAMQAAPGYVGQVSSSSCNKSVRKEIVSETLGIRGNLAGTLARAAATFPCGTRRVLRSECLESSAPAAVEKNLHDIARINRRFGGHRTLLKLLQELVEPA